MPSSRRTCAKVTGSAKRVLALILAYSETGHHPFERQNVGRLVPDWQDTTLPGIVMAPCPLAPFAAAIWLGETTHSAPRATS